MAAKGEEVSQRDSNKVVGSKVDGGADLLPAAAPNGTCRSSRAIFYNFQKTRWICSQNHRSSQWLSPSSLPDSTPCTQSNKNETARSGSILAMYLITLSSLLYAYPHRLRTSTISSPPMAATMRARSSTTQAARRAACGRPTGCLRPPCAKLVRDTRAA